MSGIRNTNGYQFVRMLHVNGPFALADDAVEDGSHGNYEVGTS